MRLELGDVADSLLVGAYGVEDPDQLDGPQARAYVQGLERFAGAARFRFCHIK